MDNNYIQWLVDGMSANEQENRRHTQMTLGDLIAFLEQTPSGEMLASLQNPHSYRGYYCDLAFEQVPDERAVSAESLLELCRSCMGKVFQGYKGGDFMMGANTPVWIASYGSCGEKIKGIDACGKWGTEPDA